MTIKKDRNALCDSGDCTRYNNTKKKATQRLCARILKAIVVNETKGLAATS